MNNRLTLEAIATKPDSSEFDPTDYSLILATAHPDDEALVAGLLHTSKRQGRELAAVTATMGEDSTEYHHGTVPSDPAEFQKLLKQTRSEEFRRSFGFVGVRSTMQFLLDYPDGKLNEIQHAHRFSEDLAKISFGVLGMHPEERWAFLTNGREGFDGHPDHVAAHDSALKASRMLLGRYGLYVPVIGLSTSGEGAYQLPLTDETREFKLDVLRHHPSQMKFDEHGNPDPAFFNRMRDVYGYRDNLEKEETYDVFSPDDEL